MIVSMWTHLPPPPPHRPLPQGAVVIVETVASECEGVESVAADAPLLAAWLMSGCIIYIYIYSLFD